MKSWIIKIIGIISLIVLIVLIALSPLAPAMAQGDFQIVKCGGAPPQPPCDLIQIKNTVIRIINYLLAWAWLVALLFILWAAWNMVISGGDSEKITAAKSTLNNAIAGFFLVTIAFILLNFIIIALTEYDLRSLIDLLK